MNITNISYESGVLKALSLNNDFLMNALYNEISKTDKNDLNSIFSIKLLELSILLRKTKITDYLIDKVVDYQNNTYSLTKSYQTLDEYKKNFNISLLNDEFKTLYILEDLQNINKYALTSSIHEFKSFDIILNKSFKNKTKKILSNRKLIMDCAQYILNYVGSLSNFRLSQNEKTKAINLLTRLNNDNYYGFALSSLDLQKQKFNIKLIKTNNSFINIKNILLNPLCLINIDLYIFNKILLRSAKYLKIENIYNMCYMSLDTGRYDITKELLIKYKKNLTDDQIKELIVLSMVSESSFKSLFPLFSDKKENILTMINEFKKPLYQKSLPLNDLDNIFDIINNKYIVYLSMEDQYKNNTTTNNTNTSSSMKMKV